MILPQPLPLALHVAGIGRVVRRHGPPVVLEVALDAIAALLLQMVLLRPLQQGGAVPGRAVDTIVAPAAAAIGRKA